MNELLKTNPNVNALKEMQRDAEDVWGKPTSVQNDKETSKSFDYDARTAPRVSGTPTSV